MAEPMDFPQSLRKVGTRDIRLLGLHGVAEPMDFPQSLLKVGTRDI